MSYRLGSTTTYSIGQPIRRIYTVAYVHVLQARASKTRDPHTIQSGTVRSTYAITSAYARATPRATAAAACCGDSSTALTHGTPSRSCLSKSPR